MSDETSEQQHKEGPKSYEDFRYVIGKEAQTYILEKGFDVIFPNVYDRFEEVKPKIESIFGNTDPNAKELISKVLGNLQQTEEKLQEAEDSNKVLGPNSLYHSLDMLQDSLEAYDATYMAYYPKSQEQKKEEIRNIIDDVFGLREIYDGLYELSAFESYERINDYYFLAMVALASINKDSKEIGIPAPSTTGVSDEDLKKVLEILKDEINATLKEWIETEGEFINFENVPEEFQERLRNLLESQDIEGEPFPIGAVAGSELEKLISDHIDPKERERFLFLCNLAYIIRPTDQYLSAVYEEKHAV